jgi:hypothetical protein
LFICLAASKTRPQDMWHARYIVLVSPGRWERWREDRALEQAGIHDRLALPVDGLTLDRTEWGKDPA